MRSISSHNRISLSKKALMILGASAAMSGGLAALPASNTGGPAGALSAVATVQTADAFWVPPFLRPWPRPYWFHPFRNGLPGRCSPVLGGCGGPHA